MKNNKYLPGDIVRYGFGQVNHDGTYPSHNTVCVIREKASGWQNEYECIFLEGEWPFNGIIGIHLDYTSNIEENELIFSFYSDLHSKEITNACS